MTSASVDITIIIEFENLLLADMDRARTMLVKIKEQTGNLQNKSCEIIAVHNPNDVGKDFVEEMLHEAGLSAKVLGTDQHYYQLKNHASEAANGNVIAFLDSDVVPNDVWLAEITGPFWQDDEIEVVAGASHIMPEGIVGKSFALGWFFPVGLGESATLQPTKYFFANNVAFRRDTFLEYKFPTMPTGATRGACTQMAKNIVNAGDQIWKNNNAKVLHAAPNGLRHFLVRACAEGRDSSVYMRAQGMHTLHRCGRVAERTYKKIRKAVKQTLRHHKVVQLRHRQVPVSILILTSYYITSMLGGYMNIAFPKVTAKWWTI